MYFTAEYLSEIIKGLKENDIAVTLSIGERSFEEYKLLKDAGADRFLLRIETSDKKQYETMHPKASYENRKRCLSDLKRLGFETGTGCLVGLPNQSLSSLADDILFFKIFDESGQDITIPVDTIINNDLAEDIQISKGQTRVLRVNLIAYGPNSYDNLINSIFFFRATLYLF